MSSAVQPIFRFFRHPIDTTLESVKGSPAVVSLEHMLGMAPNPQPVQAMPTAGMLPPYQPNAEQAEEIKREQGPKVKSRK